jgi:hypothetical protein
VIRVKKIHSVIFEAMVYCFLFAAAAIYIEVKIMPQSLYYWNPELFLKTFEFFRGIAILPGGITTYGDKFLFQLNALPWVGTLATVAASFLIGVFSFRIVAATTRVRPAFLIVVPMFFVLCTLNQFRVIPLTKLLASLAVADIFIRLPAKNAFVRAVLFSVVSCVYMLTVYQFYWVFVALCMMDEMLRREDKWRGTLYAAMAIIILLIDYRYFSYLLHTKVESPFSALTGAIHGGSGIEAATVIGLVLLAVAVAYKKRAISGIMLLPIFLIGYVDLRTWLPSSKALFCLLLGAPLAIELFSSLKILKTIRWPVWTRIGSIAVLSILGVITISLTFNEYWSSVFKLNLFSAKQQWSDVLQEAQKPSLADALPIMVSPFILEALHHTGGLPDDLFKYRRLYPPYAANVTPEMLREDLEQGKYMVNLQQNARVCFELGLINYAELTAYDVLEYRSDLLSSYQLIALIYLLKGNYEASRPFLAMIKRNLLSSAWADRYLAYAGDPKRIESDGYLMSIKSRMLLTDDPVDSLAKRPPFFEIAQRLVAHDPENNMAREYLLSAYLLNGQIARIYETFFQGDGSAPPLEDAAIPRVCQEAALMYLEASGQRTPPSAAQRIHQTTFRDFMEYSDILQKRAAGYRMDAGAIARKFGSTYLYYYTSLSGQRQP